MSTVVNDIDYGPLFYLIGRWEGDEGMDVSPEPDGPDQNPYFETMTFEAEGDVDNANDQELAFLRYHQVVYRKSTGKAFHNESGYLSWDSRTGKVVQSLSIPRGFTLVAEGDIETTKDGCVLEVTADESSISQTAYLKDNAKTRSFEHKISVNGDELTYFERVIVDIYGSEFDHTDTNVLKRVSA